jgi:hypothetical protein
MLIYLLSYLFFFSFIIIPPASFLPAARPPPRRRRRRGRRCIGTGEMRVSFFLSVFLSLFSFKWDTRSFQ